MRFAALLHGIATPDTDRWVSASDVLRSATIAGARTAMLDKVTGSLEVGKRADIVMLDLGGYDYMPMNTLDHHLVYCENGSSIRMVIVNGTVRVEDAIRRAITIATQQPAQNDIVAGRMSTTDLKV